MSMVFKRVHGTSVRWVSRILVRIPATQYADELRTGSHEPIRGSPINRRIMWLCPRLHETNIRKHMGDNIMLYYYEEKRVPFIGEKYKVNSFIYFLVVRLRFEPRTLHILCIVPTNRVKFTGTYSRSNIMTLKQENK